MCVCFQGHSGTFTVITKVKAECQILAGHLATWDRIIGINSTSILVLTKDVIVNCLGSASGELVLTVQSVARQNCKDFGCKALTPSSCASEDFCSVACKCNSGSLKVVNTHSLPQGHCNSWPLLSPFKTKVTTDSNDNYCASEATHEKVKNRNSEDSGVTCTFSCDEEDHEYDSQTNVKLPYTNSNNSSSGGRNFQAPAFYFNSSQGRCEMRRNKGDNKHKAHKLGKDVTDQAELEPLRPKESRSPFSYQKNEPRFFSLEDGSLSSPLLRESTVSVADINLDDHSPPFQGK